MKYKFLLIILFFAYFNCKNNINNSIDNKLIGTWKLEKHIINYKEPVVFPADQIISLLTYKFDSNGNYYFVMIGKKQFKYSGNWCINNKNDSIIFTCEKLKNKKAVERYKLINDTTLMIYEKMFTDIPTEEYRIFKKVK